MGSRAACDGRSTSSELSPRCALLRLVDRWLYPLAFGLGLCPAADEPRCAGFVRPPILQPLLGREKFARVKSICAACTCCPSSAGQHGYYHGAFAAAKSSEDQR